jgi:hypothetical protein
MSLSFILRNTWQPVAEAFHLLFYSPECVEGVFYEVRVRERE